MFCLIYPIPIGRYDAYLVHHCLDLCNTHLHSMPILRIAIVNLMKQLIQLFSKYFLLFYGLIPTEELTQLDYEMICLEQYVIDEIIYSAFIGLFRRLVSCKEDFQSKKQSVVLAFFPFLIPHKKVQKIVQITSIDLSNRQSYMLGKTAKLGNEYQMAKNSLVSPLSPPLSQNQSKDLFLRKSYTFQLFSLLKGYQLIAATPAITLYRIVKPLQIKRSKMRRVTSIFWLHVESPEIRTGPNIIQQVKPDSYIILHTFILSSFIFSSILKQSQAIYSLSINIILLRPCLSITNLRMEKDFCSSSAKFCFSEFSIRQSSLTPQWQNVANAVAAMKFMPWVQRISSSIKLQAESTLLRQPLNFILNSYLGGVLPRSFSICLAVQASTCLFYIRSLSLGSFSQS